MRGLLWLLGLFALAAALAVAGRYNEGYALLVWPPYRLQISLNLLVLLLVGGFVALYTLSRVVARTMALPRAVQRYRERKSRERASQAIYDTVRLRIKDVSVKPSSRPLPPTKRANRRGWRRCWPPAPPTRCATRRAIVSGSARPPSTTARCVLPAS